MSIASNKHEKMATLVISLPEGFSSKIMEEMNKEIVVAQRKWDVFLVPDARQEILDHSMIQLERKVTAVCKHQWNTNNEHVRVVLTTKTDYTGPRNISLPQDEAEVGDIQLVRGHNEWLITDEPTSEAIAMADFSQRLLELILTWGRTAVFYGVGSYT